MRRGALHRVLPNYPQSSLARGAEGVAVVAIRVDLAGAVAEARVLEAPDRETGLASTSAGRRWKFGPVTVKKNGELVPATVNTRLTFHFEAHAEPGGRVTLFGEPILSGTTTSPASRRQCQPRSVSEMELAPLMRQADAGYVDIRSREEFRASHRAGALNIPADEVRVRARELTSLRTIVVECSLQHGRHCEMVARQVCQDVPDSTVHVFWPNQTR